jgi:glycerophosphoryl diester phosphodiesterase
VTVIIAHRGASRAERENTLAAFVRAGELGADGVELDVRRTADDRLVVHHDPVLADGRLIRSTRSADLPDEVPTLAASLDACRGMFVNIEIKNDPDEPDFDPTEWVAHRVVADLAHRTLGAAPSATSPWLLSSFRPETVTACRRLWPSVRTAWLVEHLTDRTIESAAAAGYVAIHPRVDLVTEETVRRAHALGVAVNVWTCDDPTRMAELMGWGVDGICTNVPDVAVGVRTRRSD